MKFLLLTVFCNLLSLGYLQDTYNERDDYNLLKNQNDWPEQTAQGNFYDQTLRSVPPMPCSRRKLSEKEPVSQQISPPLSPKVEALTSTVVPHKKPTLKNKEHELEIANNQEPHSQLTKDSNKPLNPLKSLRISNPVIDSTEENHREIIPTINDERHKAKPLDQIQSAPTSDTRSASPNEGRPSNRDKSQSPGVSHFEPNNEYGPEIENNYISEPSKAIASEPNLHSVKINQPSTDKSEPEFTVERTHILPPEYVAKLLSVGSQATELPNKCSHDTEPDNLIGHSRRSMSSYDDEDNAKAESNDNEHLRNNNDPYIESRIDNENAMTSVLNTEKNIQRSDNDQDHKSLHKSKLSTKPVSRVKPQLIEARREIMEPTNREGVVPMGQSTLMLMQSERICYACSTANNPSCWAPDRKTTVKYCRRGNNACITKTFGHGSTFTLIRDCGRTCDDSETGGIMPKYKSCSVCHKELCNGAYSINGQGIIFALLLTAVVKYFN